MSASDQFIDAKGVVERREAERALQQIQSTHPPIYEDFSRQRQEETMRRYEELFVGTSMRIYDAREQLKQRSAELKLSKPITVIQPLIKGPEDAVEKAAKEMEIQVEQQAQSSSRRVYKQTKNAEAAVTFSAAQGLAAIGGVFEGATAPLRPYNIPKTIKSLSQSETRQALRRDIQTDPLKYIVGLPSSYLGGVAAGKVAGYIGKKARLTEPKLSGEFIEVAQTREAATSDWFAQKKVPTGAWSKTKSWGTPGEGGYLDTILMPRQLTKTVFIPKVTYPSFKLSGGLLGITGFSGQVQTQKDLELLVPKVKSIQTPIQFMKQRQPQKQKSKQKQPQITMPSIIPDITPIISHVQSQKFKVDSIISQELVQVQATTPALTQKQLNKQFTQQKTAVPLYGPQKKTKKKKKKKTGKKAYESRVDPLSIIIPSVKFNVKVPKF